MAKFLHMWLDKVKRKVLHIFSPAPALAPTAATAREQPQENEDTPLTDLPDELLKIISMLAKSNADENHRGRGTGSLNVFRLVSKIHKRAAETYATSLCYREYYGLSELPLPLLSRCLEIESLLVWSELETLKGVSLCRGLKRVILTSGNLIDSLCPLSDLHCLEVLRISPASNISDLGPLAACTKLKRLSLPRLSDADKSGKCFDVSALASLTLLEHFECGPMRQSYLKDLVPLSSCAKLMRLDIVGGGTMDLTPLSVLTKIEELHVSDCMSLAPLSSCSSISTMEISVDRDCPISFSLAPLSSLPKLDRLILKYKSLTLGKEIDELQAAMPCLKVTYG